MEEFFDKAIEAGFTPLNLVLFVMLYFTLAKLGIFPRLWPKKWENKDDEKDDENKSPTLHDIHLTMNKLSEHFNHRTTEELETISKNQEDMKRGVEKISKKQDDIATHVTKIRVRQDNWHEYGIKIRKEI